MNIAGSKVGHSVGSDKDTTALRAARARSSSIGAMERYMRGFDLAPELTPYCHNTHRKTVSITSVAMEELSRQGQKASTHSRSLR